MKSYKNLFPWFKNNKDWVYADSAATSLKPQCVIDTVTKYFTHYSTNPHNNDSKLASEVNVLIENARKNIASFFNAKNNEIVFTSGATDGLNLITSNVIRWLNTGDQILTSYGEHASNLLPWITYSRENNLEIVYAGTKGKNISTSDFLEKITKKTKVISFSASSNLLGYDIDIKKIVTKARKLNKDVIIIVDATQYVTHEPIDAKKLDIDFFVCSSHKICGPSGIGILFGKEKYLLRMTPNRLGGGMNVTFNEKETKYIEGPKKFEAGTPHTEGIIGTDVAVKFIKKIGYKEIQSHLKSLKKYFDSKIKTVKNIKYVTKEYPYPIITFNFENTNPQDISNFLGKNKIIVRGGLSCVKMAHNVTSNTTGYVRISLYFYNDFKDIDKIITVLRKYKKGDEVKYIL